MRLCAAQYQAIAGAIEENACKHTELIRLAAAHGVELIVFPELSLTGYEPKLARDLATDQDDGRLRMFQDLSDAHDMIIGVGVPIATSANPRISMILFQPGRARQTYSKLELHEDEVPFFTAGDTQMVLESGPHCLAFGICYESLKTEHFDAAAKSGADIYAASVAKHDRGVTQAYTHYAAVARKHSMTVLMANSVGPCDDFVGAGRSAIRNSRGELVSSMDGTREGVLIFDTETGASSILHHGV